MKKQLLFIECFLLLLSPISADNAPPQQWNKTFGGINADDAFSVQQTSDGGYVLVGSSWSFAIGQKEIWLIKTDSAGNQQWNKTYGDAFSDDAFVVKQTSDGGYILTDGSHIIKTDIDGNIWGVKTFKKIDTVLSYSRYHSVQQTIDGGYILPVEYGFGLLKIDSYGNTQWNKTFVAENKGYAYDVKQTLDGGYILAGTKMSLYIEDPSFPVYEGDFWIIKTDSNGNLQWNKTYGGNESEWLYSVSPTSDGGYIVAGSVWQEAFGGGSAALIIKTYADGKQQWNKTFGGTKEDEAKSIEQTRDGGYIFVGFTESYGAGKSDFWIIKLDEDGNQQWNKTVGGAGNDKAYSVQQTLDGGYIVTGFTDSYGAGSKDVWLIKLGGQISTGKGVAPTIESTQGEGVVLNGKQSVEAKPNSGDTTQLEETPFVWSFVSLLLWLLPFIFVVTILNRKFRN